MAASSCSRLHSGAWAYAAPVAGLSTSKVAAVGAADPPIVIVKSATGFPPCVSGPTDATPAGRGGRLVRRGPARAVRALGPRQPAGHRALVADGRWPVRPSRR